MRGCAVSVTTLVAVAFPYESTASAAAEDVRRLALDVPVDPDAIAETYLQLHRQHRSTWAFEVALRPWVEKW